MTARLWARAAVAGATAAPVFGDQPDAVFGLTAVHPVHVAVSAKDYPAMDPPPPAMFGPGARPGGLPPGDPNAGAANFGFEFPYVHAACRVGDRAFPDVGLRYKGSGTYLVSQKQAKRSFKVDFDRFDAGQTFHGLAKLNLNSGVMDPTRGREALAYAVFRAAGVPAPRTAFAEVTLTVPGKYDKEYLGLYTVVEQVDKAFLKAHFKAGNGMLLKPEGIRGLAYLGDDPAAYHTPYNAKSEPTADEWKRLVAFARFLAASAALATLDGFLGLGHNYYLYLAPDTGKFAFIPWDLDLAFGEFFLFGPADQQAGLSVDHPHVGENKLIDRVLALPAAREAYRGHLKRLAAEVFAADKLGRDIEAVERLVRDPLAREKKAADGRREGAAGFGPPGPVGPPPSLKAFVEKRAASVLAQLDGKGRGDVPTMSFGPPGGFGPGGQLAKPLRDALDANKDGKVTEEEMSAGMKRLFREWDAEGNRTVDQKEIADGLQRLLPPPPGGPPKR